MSSFFWAGNYFFLILFYVKQLRAFGRWIQSILSANLNRNSLEQPTFLGGNLGLSLHSAWMLMNKSLVIGKRKPPWKESIILPQDISMITWVADRKQQTTSNTTTTPKKVQKILTILIATTTPLTQTATRPATVTGLSICCDSGLTSAETVIFEMWPTGLCLVHIRHGTGLSFQRPRFKLQKLLALIDRAPGDHLPRRDPVHHADLYDDNWMNWCLHNHVFYRGHCNYWHWRIDHVWDHLQWRDSSLILLWNYLDKFGCPDILICRRTTSFLISIGCHMKWCYHRV